MGAPGRRGARSSDRRCAACGSPIAADNTARVCSRCHREQRDQLRTPPVLGDEFWSTDDMRAAFESQHMGQVLKAYRNHPRHLQVFGKALNQELLGRWIGLAQAQVSKFENGKPEQNLQTLRSYARILHMPPHMLWFDMPGQTRLAERRHPGTPDLLVNSMLRMDAEPRSLHVPRAAELAQFASEIGVADRDPLVRASRLVDARAHFERMYRNSGGVVAGARIEQFLARQALPFVVGTAADAGGMAKRAVGGLIALAGVCAYDAEDWVSASSKFAQALRIAEMSATTVFTLMCWH